MNENKGRTKKGLWINCRRHMRVYYLRFRRLKGNAHEVAGGIAIGIFIALTPTIPFQTLLAIAFAFIFRVSKVAAFLGIWVNNPVTMPFIYILDFKLGGIFLGPASPHASLGLTISHLLTLGWRLALPLLIGGAITGIGNAVPFYFIAKYLYREHQKQRAKRLREKRLLPETLPDRVET